MPPLTQHKVTEFVPSLPVQVKVKRVLSAAENATEKCLGLRAEQGFHHAITAEKGLVLTLAHPRICSSQFLYVSSVYLSLPPLLPSFFFCFLFHLF